jgi:hypothetical protein
MVLFLKSLTLKFLPLFFWKPTGEFGANNIPVALPLFDEEIFQKIPVVRPAVTGRPGTTNRPGTTGRPGPTAAGARPTERPGTTSRPITSPPAGGVAPAFSPRLVHVEVEKVKKSNTTSSQTQVSAGQHQPIPSLELADVYDYFAANQIEFVDVEDVEKDDFRLDALHVEGKKESVSLLLEKAHFNLIKRSL